MNEVTIFDLLSAIGEWNPDRLKTELRRVKRQHIPPSDEIYPSLAGIIESLYHHIARQYKKDPQLQENVTDHNWQVLPDVAYEILEILRRFYSYGEEKNGYADHFLYLPLLHGDIRMLEYLWTLEPLKDHAGEQPLGDLFYAAIKDYCYMRLPDWESFPSSGRWCKDLDLESKDWLKKLYEQAERCHIAPPAHLEFMLKHGCKPDPEIQYVYLSLSTPDLNLSIDHDIAKCKRSWTIHDQRMDHQTQDCSELVKACLRSGEYWSLTCVCGDPQCVGFYDPVLSIRFGDVVRWRIPSSMDDDPRKVRYRSLPVKDYLCDMDLLLESIERNIKKDGFAELERRTNCDPETYFVPTPQSLERIRALRRLIRLEMAGKPISAFKRQGPISFVF